MSCCKSWNGFTSQIVFYIPEKYHGNLKIDTNRRDSFLEIVGFLVLIFGVSFGVIVARYPGSLGISHYHLSGGAYPAARSF